MGKPATKLKPAALRTEYYKRHNHVECGLGDCQFLKASAAVSEVNRNITRRDSGNFLPDGAA